MCISADVLMGHLLRRYSRGECLLFVLFMNALQTEKKQQNNIIMSRWFIWNSTEWNLNISSSWYRSVQCSFRSLVAGGWLGYALILSMKLLDYKVTRVTFTLLMKIRIFNHKSTKNNMVFCVYLIQKAQARLSIVECSQFRLSIIFCRLFSLSYEIWNVLIWIIYSISIYMCFLMREVQRMYLKRLYTWFYIRFNNNLF